MKNKNLSGGLFAAAKPQPLTIKETPLSAQIRKYLDARNIENDRLNSGAIRAPSGHWIQLCKRGTPDRIAIVRGQAIYIEAKQFGKEPTEVQILRHDELRRAGAIVLVVDDFYKFECEFSAIRAEIEEAERIIKLYE